MLFSFSGIVQKHLRRGTALGYPTANIDVRPETPEGIFVGLAHIENKRYPSLVFVGKALTFDEDDKKAEIFILDFDSDIYGKILNVEVHKKLRDNQKFNTSEALVQQIKKDELQARDFFSTING
ncbi:hypothetical protein COV49_02745 [Candidatus Falkowbacteria bacterium CG11_big_fil_rev_8_21_14_0_20_39_10]|uniref:riboflavin kinase n=1 Tax=Candidatus Falkowbacteria bacterium CG11_big_fil_rev_8_21_14_0_20_39_10 TaxID=1974570 RepID=A0A2M6K969_9BACT|nr:MAG: hypothetical protein COV49_02745 [Candidatus Falkowbacteria bacterium CG11_big_fil_rev_8_21_14_0_20_39_10]